MSGAPEDVVQAAEAIFSARLWNDAGRGRGEVVAALVAAIMAERERCTRLLEDGFERPVAVPYAAGHRSKNDTCPHGRYMYEDCEPCCATAIRSGLKP